MGLPGLMAGGPGTSGGAASGCLHQPHLMGLGLVEEAKEAKYMWIEWVERVERAERSASTNLRKREITTKYCW